jgi:uncharacterized repeat protein (TIGR03803 family)
MKCLKLLLLLRPALFLMIASFSLVPSAWSAPKYTVLYAFLNKSQGWGPYAGVVFDGQGNLYGTAIAGGEYDWGVVYELTPKPDGKWSEKVLYSFCPGGWPCSDGTNPNGGLILDSAGNLYGTTVEGGTAVPPRGTIFELSDGSGGWTHTVLYNFCSLSGCEDGGSPKSSLVMDPAGNLYGTAGYAVELSPGSDGWTEKVLYKFCSKSGCSDGYDPYAGVILDATGNLYGTTEGGGNSACTGGCGTVYQIRHMPDGGWKENVLHRFYAFYGDGVFPGVGALILDSSDHLYGTTAGGGANGNGTVFKLTRRANDQWKETILYSFKNGPSGNGPSGGVLVDKAGNLYGTTMYGGNAQCDCGVVYKLSPHAGGKWKYTVLHAFTGYDGAAPEANLILDSKGNLYGTTPIGAPPRSWCGIRNHPVDEVVLLLAAFFPLLRGDTRMPGLPGRFVRASERMGGTEFLSVSRTFASVTRLQIRNCQEQVCDLAGRVQIQSSSSQHIGIRVGVVHAVKSRPLGRFMRTL